MNSEAFVEFLKDLSKDKVIDLVKLNEDITKKFEYYKFIERNDKNYFRRLIGYYLLLIKKEDLPDVLRYLEIIYKKIYTNKSTLDAVLSVHIRKPIFERFGKNSEEHKLAKAITRLTYEEKGDLITEQKIKLIKKHSALSRFDPKEVILIIKNSIKSYNVYDKIIGLSLACGSRPVELFDDEVVFTKIDENWIHQNKVAKKRGEIVSVDKPIIAIGTDTFIEELDNARRLLNERFPDGIIKNGKPLSTLQIYVNQVMKNIFQDNDGITFYSCRKIYGNLSYQLYSKDTRYGKDISLQLWLSKCLGHNEEDLATANHYSTFKSTESKVEERLDKIEKVLGL